MYKIYHILMVFASQDAKENKVLRCTKDGQVRTERAKARPLHRLKHFLRLIFGGSGARVGKN